MPAVKSRSIFTVDDTRYEEGYLVPQILYGCLIGSELDLQGATDDINVEASMLTTKKSTAPKFKAAYEEVIEENPTVAELFLNAKQIPSQFSRSYVQNLGSKDLYVNAVTLEVVSSIAQAILERVSEHGVPDAAYATLLESLKTSLTKASGILDEYLYTMDGVEEDSQVLRVSEDLNKLGLRIENQDQALKSLLQRDKQDRHIQRF